jgi:uncharacterized membrane protein
MEKKEIIKSVTFILAGSLLQMFNGIGGGIWTTLAAVFGIVLFFIGLSRLKGGLDEAGQSAIKLLIVAAVLSGIGFIFDLIPLIGGIIASVFVLAAFVIQLIGYIKLKCSDTIGDIGKSGVMLLLIAMILAAFGALLGIVPFLGGVVVSIVSFAGLVLLFFGWIKIQEGLMD